MTDDPYVTHRSLLFTRRLKRQLPESEDEAMSTANKATYGRLLDAVNSGDAELISKTIDEVVEPDLLIRRRLPVEATGAQALKQGGWFSFGHSPTFTSRWRI